jgi:hypothetical protein
MKNPIKPTTTLTHNGVTFELLFDFEATALAEDVSDRPLITGLKQRDFNQPSINLVRAMLFACIHANHPDVTFAQAKAMVDRKNLADVWRTVLVAWFAFLAEPDPDKDAADADPTKGQD